MLSTKSYLITAITVGLVAVAVMLALASRLVAQAPSNEQDYVGTELGGEPAFDFRLTDQAGNTIGLSDSRGKMTVVAFLAPECTDVCPLTASQLRQASETLKKQGIDITLLAVNTNSQRATPADMAAAGKQWDVATLPNWHYVTGNPDELARVWRAYNVFTGAKKDAKPNETDHSAGVYLIDQSGRMRWFISVPYGMPGFRPLDQLLVEHAKSIKA